MQEMFVQRTNECAQQRGEHNWDFTLQDLHHLIGIFIYTGIDCRPTVRDHFLQTHFGKSPVASVMTERHFWKVLRHFRIHSNQNFLPRGAPGHDPYAQVRPLYDMLTLVLPLHYKAGIAVSVDESLHACQARCWFVQYINSKHHRWGLKHFVISCYVTGFVLFTIPYLGAHTVQSQPGQEQGLLASEMWCLRLVEHLCSTGYIIFMDRWFSGIRLFQKLADLGFGAVGTIQRNRVGLPEAAGTVKRADINSPKFLRKDKLLYCAWFDKENFVPILSTVHAAGTVQVAVRDKKATPFGFRCQEKPTIVHHYNHCMGAVDHGDQMAQSYHLYPHRNNLWWVREIIRLLEIGVHNAFVLYSCYPENQLSSRAFRQFLLATLWEDVLPKMGLNCKSFIQELSTANFPDPSSVTTDEFNTEF